MCFRCAAYSRGGNIELILTAMETRHPVGGPLSREFSAFLTIAELRRPEIASKFFEQFLRFLEKRPRLEIFFFKFCSESLHGDTDRRCCVEMSYNFSDYKLLKPCVIRMTKNSASSLTVATARIALKICQSLPWPASHIWLILFQLSSKSTHFRWSCSRPREDHFGPIK